jgi:hypothetical protein
MATFKDHFTKENTKHVRKLTTKTGGYHGADNTKIVPTPSAALLTPAPPMHVILSNGVKMYYCWTRQKRQPH